MVSRMVGVSAELRPGNMHPTHRFPVGDQQLRQTKSPQPVQKSNDV